MSACGTILWYDYIAYWSLTLEGYYTFAVATLWITSSNTPSPFPQPSSEEVERVKGSEVDPCRLPPHKLISEAAPALANSVFKPPPSHITSSSPPTTQQLHISATTTQAIDRSNPLRI